MMVRQRHPRSCVRGPDIAMAVPEAVSSRPEAQNPLCIPGGITPATPRRGRKTHGQEAQYLSRVLRNCGRAEGWSAHTDAGRCCLSAERAGAADLATVFGSVA